MRADAGPAPEDPAPELVEAGFALEIADAPLLHAGLNLADMAHLLALRERGVIPASSARRLLDLLLEVHELLPRSSRTTPRSARPTTAASASSANAWAARRAGSTPGGPGGRPAGLPFEFCSAAWWSV